MFYFSDYSLVFMLFFMFLYCTPIMVMVIQMKSLMDTRLLNLSPLRSTQFSLQVAHFIIIVFNFSDNSLVFMLFFIFLYCTPIMEYK